MEIKKKCLVLKPLAFFVIVVIMLTSGCLSFNSQNSSTDDIKVTMTNAAEKINSINWNTDHPGNIRAKLLGAETDFTNSFNLLSGIKPETGDESEEIYGLRAISCGYLEMISAMMDLTNVIEHYNYADYYASLYEQDNWVMEIRTADTALASARNKLYSAKYRLDGINMNMVPLNLQGDLTEMKVRMGQLDKIMENLATEFSKALK
ncbi:hypothetical protein F1737_04870 [Methanoplanus sp. FWC-SCC4]|uniref:Lipoprotein n=1 Tax=Methanochimaera problematica TaxID=2609417 RepID=A0AA97FD83_9EURY|nr:hypothetical protein [Methanoplanus sp. FWC-SCC4]WOF16084.1 hypothetical protein F1737_04870 [Methanoplanus sp. FWC-SCC4]